jgi:hypothetical protein
MSEGIATGHGFSLSPVQSLSKVPFRLKFIFSIKKLFQEKPVKAFQHHLCNLLRGKMMFKEGRGFHFRPPFND